MGNTRTLMQAILPNRSFPKKQKCSEDLPDGSTYLRLSEWSEFNQKDQSIMHLRECCTSNRIWNRMIPALGT